MHSYEATKKKDNPFLDCDDDSHPIIADKEEKDKRYLVKTKKWKGLADIILSLFDKQDFINILERLKKDDKLKSLYERFLDVDKILVTKVIDHELLTYLLKNSTQEEKEKIGNFFIAVIQAKRDKKEFRITSDLKHRSFKECYQLFPDAINQRICQAFIKSAADWIQEAITKSKDAKAKLERSKEEFKDISNESLMNEHYEQKYSKEFDFADTLKNIAIVSLVSSFYVVKATAKP